MPLESMAKLLGAAVIVFAMPLRGSAITESLTDADISRALSLANGPAATRTAFHKPYIITLDGPTVEQIEVITEFRRFVMAAEEQLEAGNWTMGRGSTDQKGRTLKDVLRKSSGQLFVRARLRFHPLNSFVDLPPFDILLGEPTLLPIATTRVPNVTPASTDRKTRPIFHGATIETAFNAPSVNNRTLPIRIISAGDEVGRAVVDFSRLE
jgi:hypothetical protein